MTALYERFAPGNEIFLMCVSKAQQPDDPLSQQHGTKRKSYSEDIVIKRQAKDDEIDSIFQQLTKMLTQHHSIDCGPV